ncbi:MAG: hypothetical protein HKO59_15810 [Phycisphaerales bacterium]|nr:hypothetical protein [Phycisphaerae bacterium]NNF43145.1 hypothetical protein [Phycisphaerales bacterium]NNM27421.1 hypothetical protein [Phycisphaerales bacterium]
MPNLTRPATRPSATSKLLLVRSPAKSVRREDQPDRMPVRLAIGVIVAVGVLLLVWLIGHLGYRLGFAPLLRVPDLTGAPMSGLAIGTLVLVSIPHAVFRAGLSEPIWLMAGFVLIALPAAGLGAARPSVPGGPRPKTAIVAMASTGAVVAMLSGIAIIWWTGCGLRVDRLGMLPADPGEAAAWHQALLTVAGADVLAMVAAATWVVLVMRLPIPLWLRAIAASAAFFTLTVATVAMAISNTAATQVATMRTLAAIDGDGTPALIVGTTPRHLAVLRMDDAEAAVELHAPAQTITVRGRQSIVGFLEDVAAQRPRP